MKNYNVSIKHLIEDYWILSTICFKYRLCIQSIQKGINELYNFKLGGQLDYIVEKKKTKTSKNFQKNIPFRFLFLIKDDYW